MNAPLVSIIIPCKNEGENVQNTINSIKENSGYTPYEIIVVDNASDDGCCDFLRKEKKDGIFLIDANGNNTDLARNTGAANANGDIFVFCDPHILVEKNWLQSLTDSLKLPGTDAVAPCIRPLNDDTVSVGGLAWGPKLFVRWLPAPQVITPVPVLPKSCFAVKRQVFELVGGFDTGFRMNGYDDVEFTLKLWLFGFGSFVNPAAVVRHIFRGSRPGTANNRDIHYNLLRLATLHFNQVRLNKIIAQIKDHEYFAAIFTTTVLSDALELRHGFLERQVNDDDWYTKKFGINF